MNAHDHYHATRFAHKKVKYPPYCELERTLVGDAFSILSERPNEVDTQPLRIAASGENSTPKYSPLLFNDPDSVWKVVKQELPMNLFEAMQSFGDKYGNYHGVLSAGK